MSASRAYGWAVNASLSVDTDDASAAQAAVVSALDDIRSALVDLTENVELSFPKQGSDVALTPTGNSQFATSGSLLIGSDASESAQTVASDAAAAIATAVAETSPAVTVTLDNENGQYVLQEIG